MGSRTKNFIYIALLMLAVALTIGSEFLLTLAVCMLIMLTAAFVCVLSALFTIKIDVRSKQTRIKRGDSASLMCFSRFYGLIPAGKIVFIPDEGPEMQLSPLPFLSDSRRYSLTYPHRGVVVPSEGRVTVTDIMELVTLSRRVKGDSRQLFVLPLTYEDEPFSTKPQSVGSTYMTVMDDADEPSSVREWRDGDLLKRLHWKLTQKTYNPVTGEIKPYVKTYDEAVRPDVLILPDLRPIDAELEERFELEDRVCDMTLTQLEAFARNGISAHVLLDDEELEERETIENALAINSFTSETGLDELAAQVLKRSARLAAAVFVSAGLTFADAEILMRLKRASQCEVALVLIANEVTEEAEKLLTKLEGRGVQIRIC